MMTPTALAVLVAVALAAVQVNCYIPTQWGSHATGHNESAVGSPSGYAPTSLASKKFEYCIIGAGPAGLQMARHLKTAGRDFAVFEKNSHPGSFFAKYPIHRQLVSINKRYAPLNDSDYQLRFDWNSLLSDDGSGPLPFTTRTKEYFPHADHMVEYLKDYAEDLHEHIAYGTEIRRVYKTVEGYDEEFVLETFGSDSYQCSVLVTATGMGKPIAPQFRGGEHLTAYEDLPSLGAATEQMFEGKDVLILGGGNSAFETADAIRHYTSSIIIFLPDDVKFSWMTHYVGDIRSVNAGQIDTYQLKSLDLVDSFVPARDKGFEKILMLRTCIVDSKNRICTAPRDLPEGVENDDATFYKWFNREKVANGNTRRGYDIIIRCLGFHFNTDMFDIAALQPTDWNGNRVGLLAAGPLDQAFGKPYERKSYAQLIRLARRRSVRRMLKYPQMKGNYEAVGVENMFYAGTLMHFRDYRRSAGSDIHGFRYTVRALFRYFEMTRHGKEWPSTEMEMDAGAIAAEYVRRATTSSGLYQMHTELFDVVVLNHPVEGKATYYYEVPGSFCMPDHPQPMGLPANFKDPTYESLMWHGKSRIVMGMKYRDDYQGFDTIRSWLRYSAKSAADSHNSTFIHPMYTFIDGPADRVLSTFHQLDDSFVTFDRPWDIVQVKSWLESTLRKTGPSFGEKARWAFEDLKASTEQFRRRLWRMMPRLSKDETRLVGTASLGLLVLMVLMSPKNWMRKMKKLMRPKSRSSDVDPGSFIDTPKSKAQKGTPKKKGKK